MDQTSGLTAADVLNTYDAAELTRILRDFGEERFAGRVTSAIVRARAAEPFTTSARLVDVLRSAIPAASQRTVATLPSGPSGPPHRGQPRTRAWQAALPQAIEHLALGGRIAVMSYHSLEDRLTKRALAAGATSTTPKGLPVELPEHAAYLRLLTRGAEEASADEQARNPRSASVRLRAAERIRTTKGHLR
jgi:16S rRNA (cytosine1402-N4)-methyltransferase